MKRGPRLVASPPSHRMNPQPPATKPAPDPWEDHLRQQLAVPDRAYTLDMDDAPEQAHLAQFGVLNDAIQFLNQEVTKLYQAADQAARKHQGRHRHLARWAIWTGAVSVMLAIVQPALKEASNEWSGRVLWLEGAAVLIAVIAVGFGLKAKFDSQWFVQRHVAERLRMLKFQALGQAELWCGNFPAWESWVRGQIQTIRQITSIGQVKQWAEGGEAEPFEPIPPPCALGAPLLRAYSSYYCWKRVKFQSTYFKRQAETFRQRSQPLAHLGLPLFFLTIAAAVLHFAADWRAHVAETDHAESAAHLWHSVGLWALTAAALLPVAGLCVRAWLGAFEHTRSASLFEAKSRALESLSGQLRQDGGDLAKTMHHIAHVEHFLEHEHREWLRLMLEAEWFL